jgi:TonB family protein
MNMGLRRLWGILSLGLMPLLALASVPSQPSSLRPQQESLAARESQLWASAMRDSEFASVPHVTTRASCEATRQAEALATPNPLWDAADAETRITVSFIIGTDGRVHSPLILESAGPSGDRTVLDTVRTWRYRPATCNGVPTEVEARIEFSRR